VGSTLRCLHDLHCYLGGQRGFAVVQPDPRSPSMIRLYTEPDVPERALAGASGSMPNHALPYRATTKLLLVNFDALQSRRRPSNKEALKDLRVAHGELSSVACSRTDVLRLLLSYLRLSKLDKARKPLCRALLQCQTSAALLGILDRFAPVPPFKLNPAEQGTVP
jgi:hypothetical protein